MEIAENEWDGEKRGIMAKIIKNWCMDLYMVNCRPKALEHDRPTSFITQIMCLVVD